VDCTTTEARVAVQEFLHGARRDDVSLIYVSSHGVQDARGELHFAFTDTFKSVLDATAVSADWLRRQMYDSRSGSIIVLLDCCFSGAFIRGMRPRGIDNNVAQLVQGLPEGSGVAVLTASGETEYSLEENDDRTAASVRPSYFTEAVITGIGTGAADTDGDGRITVDELYSFVAGRIRQGPSPQRPQRMGHGEGDLVVADAPRLSMVPPLPPPPEPRGSSPPTQFPPAVYGGDRPGEPTRTTPGRRNRKRRTAGVLLAAVVLLVGCGGVGYGGWQIYRNTIGQGPGTERLAQQTSGNAGNLALTVTSVRVSTRRTSVEVTAKNASASSLTVPIWSNCSLIEPGGGTHPGNTDSTFPQDIPGGQTVHGTMIFDRAVPADVHSVNLACSTVYGRDSPPGAQVNNIPLK
jgi:hypothetical protein